MICEIEFMDQPLNIIDCLKHLLRGRIMAALPVPSFIVLG